MKKTLIAYCTQKIASTGNEFMLFPAGEFRANDGRPAECACWVMNAANAQVLIAAANARGVDYVTDYEHQTLRAKENGKPAPASGWFHELEWREGDGLYAVNVRWTANASTMIADDEYRYISPVFSYDRNGNITGLLNAALTNTPALDNMEEVLLAAASMLSGDLNEDTSMNEELLERLRWLLNMPEGSTAEDISAQLDKIKARLGTAAASFNLETFLTDSTTSIAALSQQLNELRTAQPQAVDLSQYVPISVVREKDEQIAALSSQQQDGELETLLTAALSDGRIVGKATEDWLREMGKTNMAGVRNYLENVATPIAALTSLQTSGTKIRAINTLEKEKDPLLLAVCSQFGNDPAVIAKALEELNNGEH
ncbi:phage protease [Enterobacter ludwigii]|uniref:phage protease n=1 Tax=Enterobacter ludwigii TaxID=299767 RepID=UPI0013D5FF18|nr:phage protease [Enterobacter ludwigii]